MLGELETAFPKVFDEPQYPITANRTQFTIELVDPALPPKGRKLYPMSSLELDELHSQIKTLLESGRIVPSSSPYSAPVLFAEKKVGGGIENVHGLYILKCK